MFRFIAVFTCFSLLAACNTTQDVAVETTTRVTGANVSTNTKIRIREIPYGTSVTAVSKSGNNTSTSKEVSKSNSPMQNMIKLDPKVDQSDLVAVSSYCEKLSFKALYIKESCKSSSDRKVCKSAQFGNATFMKEFKYCLKQYGWETY